MLRKTKVFATARQNRLSLASRRTLSRPVKAGSVTRSHWRKTSITANSIGYAAKASRNPAYGAASSVPDRCSARIQNIPRFGSRACQRLSDGDSAVDGGFLVRLRDKVEDLDYVGIQIQITGPPDVTCVCRQRRPPGERGGESLISHQRATIGELAGLLYQHAIGSWRRKECDEIRSRVGMLRRRENRDASQVCESIAVVGIGSIGRRHRSNIVTQVSDFQLVQLLHEPGTDDFHCDSSV